VARIEGRGDGGVSFPVCVECASTNVVSDATVSYNRETRKWEMETMQGGTWCNHCSEETIWMWVVTDPADVHYHLELNEWHIKNMGCEQPELTELQQERLAVLMLVEEGTGVEGVGVRLSETGFIINGI
jgi:hypothetical protein